VNVHFWSITAADFRSYFAVALPQRRFRGGLRRTSFVLWSNQSLHLLMLQRLGFFDSPILNGDRFDVLGRALGQTMSATGDGTASIAVGEPVLKLRKLGASGVP